MADKQVFKIFYLTFKERVCSVSAVIVSRLCIIGEFSGQNFVLSGLSITRQASFFEIFLVLLPSREKKKGW